LPRMETERRKVLQMDFSGDGACGIRTRALRLAKLSSAFRGEPA
jgi:hypothetical protein